MCECVCVCVYVCLTVCSFDCVYDASSMSLYNRNKDTHIHTYLHTNTCESKLFHSEYESVSITSHEKSHRWRDVLTSPTWRRIGMFCGVRPGVSLLV